MTSNVQRFCVFNIYMRLVKPLVDTIWIVTVTQAGMQRARKYAQCAARDRGSPEDMFSNANRKK